MNRRSLFSGIGYWGIAGTVFIGAAAGLCGAAAADTVVYDCADGFSFNANFDNSADTATLELSGGVRIVLTPAVSGSGFRYTGGGYELHGKGNSANVIRPGQPAVNCQETGRVHAGPPRPATPPPSAPPSRMASPSFKCGGRLNPTERRICSNPALADLDREMVDIYSWLLGQMRGNAQRESLKNDQRNWLRQRNACGATDQCIQGQLYERMAYLNEYLEPGSPPPVQHGASGFPMQAQSWGGIVRSGPGQSYPKVASLREGEPITILEQTGHIFQDRPWFKISYRSRVGYHWGGIICPKDRPVPGTYQVCN